jgi:hypothetical protein
MKYRKKPVVIEAFQWIDKPSFPEGFEELHEKAKITKDEKLAIETLEGSITASNGDFIIKGINGEFYPCKPDIFEKTYEKVEE